MGVVDVIIIAVFLAASIVVADLTESIDTIYFGMLVAIPGALLLLSFGGYVVVPSRGFSLIFLAPPMLAFLLKGTQVPSRVRMGLAWGTFAILIGVMIISL